MYHAASALLAAPASSSDAFKTHSGLVGAFHKTFVLPGTIDREFGRSLARMLQMRLLADYSNDPPTRDDTVVAISQADVFIAAIGAILPKSSEELDRP